MSVAWETRFRAGDLGESAFRLVKGLGRVVTIQESGADAALRLVLPGDWIGLEALYDGQHAETLETVKGTELQSYELDRISPQEMLAAASNLQLQMNRELETRLSSQDRRTRYKLAGYLNLLTQTSLSRKSAAGIVVFVTHSFLGELLWNQKQTISQSIVSLRAQGFIRTGYSYIEVLDGEIPLEEIE